MRRRQFSALTSLGIASAILPVIPARAQAPDPSVLKTRLTPLGATRAGNADRTIPAWTGGLTAPALPATQPIDVPLFTNDAPLYSVDARNMAQYENLLTPGTQAVMRKFGFCAKIYQTHRTAAAPQYVYDNTAKNVTRSQLDPAGGQMGFTGAYGGVPFPIIDTENTLAGGAQLIWNHLTSWRGFFRSTKYSSNFVVVNGTRSLSVATSNQSIYPYYDPNGSLTTYTGYFNKAHWQLLPLSGPLSQPWIDLIICSGSAEDLYPKSAWLVPPDTCIGRVLKFYAQDAYAAFNPTASKIAALDEYACFYGKPGQYDWRFISKQEMLVPYNCNAMHFQEAQDILGPNFPNPDVVRWEKHRVWVVEARLRPGQTNVLARRRLYIDEDSWQALLGEGFDATDKMIKYHAAYNHSIPSLPATCVLGSMVLDLLSGNYVYDGSIRADDNAADEFAEPQSPAFFEPQTYMARTCSWL